MQRKRERDTEMYRERGYRETDRDIETVRDTETDRQKDRDTQRETERKTETEKHRERGREGERERDYLSIAASLKPLSAYLKG